MSDVLQLAFMVLLLLTLAATPVLMILGQIV